MPPGLLVSNSAFLTGSGGGVQVCTAEYVDLLTRAGFDLEFCRFDIDRRLSTRVLKRLFSSPYYRNLPAHLTTDVIAACRARPGTVVFLNQVALATMAPALKKALPGSQIVLLSHGLESTDLIHGVRTSGLPVKDRLSPNTSLVLGHVLVQEAILRTHVDAVCSLSPFDADLERWMGTRQVCWLPRSIVPAPVAWHPHGDRLGFVGTLEHLPNLDGLVQVLDCLARCSVSKLRVRIVGGPERIGRWLAERYNFVESLGHLGDDALNAEVATWNAFLHPIFCLARGCSTKLASALAWQIPIITTEFGHRGYHWQDGALIAVETPEHFARECLRLLNAQQAASARTEVGKVARSSPSHQDNANALMRFLEAALRPAE